jgi:hypothetical protein
MRAFLVLLVFVILGPPLGATVLIGLMSVLTSNAAMPATPLDGWLRVAAFVALMSYVFGGTQALIVGFAMCAWYLRGRSKLLPVTPVLIATAVVVIGVLPFFGVSSVEPLKSDLIAAAIAVHFGASLGCWVVANLLLWPMRHRSQEIIL